MKYSGRLRLRHSEATKAALSITLELEDDELRIHHRDQMLGRWGLTDIALLEVDYPSVALLIEGEDWVFVPDDRNGFMEMAVPALQTKPQATGIRALAQSAGDWLSARPLVVAGTAFVVGFAVARFQPVDLLTLTATTVAVALVYLGASNLYRARTADPAAQSPSSRLRDLRDRLRIRRLRHTRDHKRGSVAPVSPTDETALASWVAALVSAGAGTRGQGTDTGLRPLSAAPSSDHRPQTDATAEAASNQPPYVGLAVERMDEPERIEPEIDPALESLTNDADDPEIDDTAVPDASEAPADDLTTIFGIGPAIAAVLRELGYTSYAQIARLDAEDKERISQALGPFGSRVERDNWQQSAASAHLSKYGTYP